MAINFNLLKQWWNKDKTFKMLIPSTVLLILSFFTHINIFGFLTWIFLFTIFDSLGFYLLQVIEKYKNNDFENIAYRTIQIITQVILTLLIYFMCGWKAALAGNIAWWFTTCDKMFYMFRNEPDYGGNREAEYIWLNNWSIFFILKFFGVKTYTREFTTMATLGLVLGSIICFL
jgi:hypothetical protein